MQTCKLQGMQQGFLLHMLEIKTSEWILGMWCGKQSVQSRSQTSPHLNDS